MKRNMLILTLVAALGLIAAQAFAWGPGNGYGCRGYNTPVAQDDGQYQEFLNQTADLRKQLALDHAELAAVMHSDNPDTAQVRALTERILDTQTALDDKAEELNVTNGYNCPFGGGGYGRMGGNGYGGGRMMRGDW